MPLDMFHHCFPIHHVRDNLPELPGLPDHRLQHVDLSRTLVHVYCTRKPICGTARHSTGSNERTGVGSLRNIQRR